ncbi:ATP-dependent RNA helicase DDX51 [Notechis scutatus]|uniref:ATP-dependent RNA helicase n=1 Tax=Notechis scutatus TaxID=8663 RepID=A0A6J1V5U3_9SAUR|nr:ATP-dependent RNA helicase DDX51 [Notechis scutatus]
MALFVVPRYVSDEEDNPECKSQLLLHRLQEQAKTRQLQKQEQNWPTSGQRKRLAPGAPEEETNEELKQTGKKKKVSQESLSAQSHREKEPRRPTFGAESLPEKDGSSKRKKNGGNSRTPQGKTEAVQGDEGMLETHPESRATPEEEGMGGFGDKESQARKDQRMQTPNPRTASSPSSMIVLGPSDQRNLHKVQPFVPRWFSQPQQFQRQIRENLVPLQDVPVIHPKLRKKLQANGIASLFPVQAEVIPAILDCGPNGALAGRGGYPPSDICVSAPTGSGKTLAFIIPVVQALLDRVVCHVRALAVLPTKELAQQVAKIFNIYTDGTGLKVVLVTGQKSFVKEQESLVETTLTGHRSLADIVIATPGRLVDHLQQSPQFSLRELRFLIMDEADRMIDNMHQDWLQQVVEAVHRPERGSGPGGLFRRVQPSPCTAARACSPRLPLQRLLFSATLTQNPEKLQRLGLYQPRLFAPVQSGKGSDGLGSPSCVSEKYILPEGLSHYYVPCNLNWKPLFLLHFLVRLKFTQVLCFTNSKETSHRLFLLIQAFGGVKVAEFSSKLSPSKRKVTLKEFEQGKIQLLISTDATARGIDFGGVKCVISYDAPQFIRTYVHRVGRTARAGKAGLAFSLLLKRQEHRFLKMLKDAGLPELQPQLVKSASLQPLLQQYEAALAELAQTVKEEQVGKRF